MREIVFTAKCNDPRYGYESYYLKQVRGKGFKMVAGDAYLLVDHEWLEVELDSVQIDDSMK